MNKLTGKTRTSILRNILTFTVGGTVGLYFGQFFPDLYWGKIDEYVMTIEKKE
jgi:hypothetical protein